MIKGILAALPRGIPFPMVIVQHMPAGFTAAFAESLDQCAPFPVREAQDREVIAPGTAYVAPSGYHLLISVASTGSPYFTLLSEKGSCTFMPSIDLALISAVTVYGSGVIGVILSGMSAGNDGLKGARVVNGVGGCLLAQQPESCVVAGMPEAVLQAGLATAVLTPQGIVGYVSRLIRQGNDARGPLSGSSFGKGSKSR